MLKAVALSLTLAAAPIVAQAGGLTLSWSPRTGQERAAAQTALTLYALSREMKSRGEVRQSGQGLSALLRQSGGGQFALVDQRGGGHGASVSQTGTPNALALFQRGRGAQADIAQTGGAAAILLQYGW